MQDIENSIRERAYHLWNDAGRPDGQSDSFWLTAQRQLLEASLAQLAAVAKVSKRPRAAKKSPLRRRRAKPHRQCGLDQGNAELGERGLEPYPAGSLRASLRRIGRARLACGQMRVTVDNFAAKQIVVTDLSGSVVRQRESVSVSLQVQIMLVLSGHPNGRATLAAMTADLKVLAGAGEGWSQRIKRLAANAPGLDIFTEGYVVRDAAGWQITAVGRKALQRIDSAPSVPFADKSLSPRIAKPAIALVASGTPFAAKPLAKVVDIADWRNLPRRAV